MPDDISTNPGCSIAADMIDVYSTPGHLFTALLCSMIGNELTFAREKTGIGARLAPHVDFEITRATGLVSIRAVLLEKTMVAMLRKLLCVQARQRSYFGRFLTILHAAFHSEFTQKPILGCQDGLF